jgi:CubicO group peptidase (beta-lactamase class C family)
MGHPYKNNYRNWLLGFLFICVSFKTRAQQYTTELATLDAYYNKALSDWDVPGMAIAIVKSDSVIFAKGYGSLNAQTGGTVDGNTIFGIASNTKAYTAAAIAILVDEGKLNWNDPVIKHLPYFQLYNPYVTQAITIKDLLSHRVGLATFSGDLLWYNTTYSREEIIRRAKYLQPVYGFRDGYGYSNIMFLVAGQVVETVSGLRWEDFIQQRFFQPLGMTQSYTSVRDLGGKSNIASPHGFNTKGKPVATTFTVWDNWNPAAGIFTSVNQHAQWLRLQLNRGVFKGKRIFSENASHAMWSAQQALPVAKQTETNNPSFHFSATGLGWMLNDYQGRKIISHGGGHEGMNSRTVMVPEEKLGIVIFTNSMSSIMSPLANQTIDVFLGIKNARDWSKTALDAKTKATEKVSKMPVVKNSKAKPNLPLTAYAGRYTSQLYGDATVTLNKLQLEIQLVPAPVLNGKLIPEQGDIFALDWKTDYPLLTPTKVRFLIGPDGNIEQMRIDANNPDFIFSELDFKKIN